jgi:hypothetical protein
LGAANAAFGAPFEVSWFDILAMQLMIPHDSHIDQENVNRRINGEMT